MTTAKYLLPPLLAVVVTARAGGAALVESLWAAAALGRARVGVVLAFIAGVLWIGHAGNNLLGDLVQELALCGFLALAMALAAWASPARPPRKDLPTGYFLHTDDAPRPRRSSPGDEAAPGTRLADPHPERTSRSEYPGAGPAPGDSEMQRTRNRGFTLVELMVVVVILGILAVLALFAYRKYTYAARNSEAVQFLGAVRAAQESYFQSFGQYCGTLQPALHPAVIPFEGKEPGTHRRTTRGATCPSRAPGGCGSSTTWWPAPRSQTPRQTRPSCPPR